ncbi:MAG: hypothetical protein V3V08_20710 [Nannocystaceae bacterium]
MFGFDADFGDAALVELVGPSREFAAWVGPVLSRCSSSGEAMARVFGLGSWSAYFLPAHVGVVVADD